MYFEYSGNLMQTTATTADRVVIPIDRITRQRGLLGLVFAFSTVQFQHVTQIVIKVNSKDKIDLTPAQFRQLLQRMAKRFNAAAYPANGDLTWFFPFYNTEYDEGDPRRYSQQLQPGPVYVEIYKNATPGAGTLRVGWAWTDQAAANYVEMSRYAIGIGANSGGETKDFFLEGALKAYMINTTGVTELRKSVNAGTTESPDLTPIFEGNSTELIEQERLEDGSASTDPICKRLQRPILARLRLRLQTSGTWAGANNELVTVRTIPAVQAAA